MNGIPQLICRIKLRKVREELIRIPSFPWCYFQHGFRQIFPCILVLDRKKTEFHKRAFSGVADCKS